MIEVLQPDGSYTEVKASPTFPAITPEEVVHWVRFADDIEDDNACMDRIRE